jgi:hypothetical protein
MAELRQSLPDAAWRRMLLVENKKDRFQHMIRQTLSLLTSSGFAAVCNMISRAAAMPIRPTVGVADDPQRPGQGGVGLCG